MAQGDIFVFDYVAYNLMIAPWKPSSFNLHIGLLPQATVPEIEDEPNEWRNYSPQLSKSLLSRTFRDDEETHIGGNPAAWEVVSENHQAAKVKYALIYTANHWFDASFAFVDLTEDGGETPWDLVKVPLRVTLGDIVSAPWNKIVTVTVE